MVSHLCHAIQWFRTCITFLRGEYFRQEFKHLGEVRSIIPGHVKCMVMTATATVATRNKVIAIVGLNDPVLTKPIFYTLSEKTQA